MDILYTGDVDAFCLVSSDSDFTRLAARLREAGKYVLGIGERKTPQALRSACNAFKLIEVISETENDKTEKTASKGAENVDLTSIEEIQKAVQKILDENGNKGKSTGIGEIGSKLQNKYPDFDVRNYGYSKLTTFIEDGLSGMALIKEGSSFRVQSKASKLTKADVEQQIIEILKKNGGQINNLGSLSRSLKQINPGFSIDSFGYRKMSSFLGSFSSLEIDGNSVRLI